MSDSQYIQKRSGYKRWVLVFVILGLLVHGGVFYFFSLDLEEPEESSPADGFIVYQAEELPLVSDELEERAYLFDSEPIFLPTTRNFSGPVKTDASVWEPEVSLAASFEPDIRWSDSLLLMETRHGRDAQTPMQLLEPISRDFVSEFGAVAKADPVKYAPGLFIEARNSTGELILKTFIEMKTTAEIDFPLNPAEFSILHTDLGLAGEPLLIKPSGSGSTDNFLRHFILEKVHPRLLGHNGYFHLKIGL